MAHRFLELAATDAARSAQTARGSRAAYARMEGGKPMYDRLGPKEEAFIVERDSFYLASVNDQGWPYVQHRGGAVGFLHVLDERQLAFADLSGNQQYLTLGNIQTDNRVALFLMDYPNRRRLKLLGRMRAVDPGTEPKLAAALVKPVLAGRIERIMLIAVEAYDWNCPKYITPRFSEAELAAELEPVRARIEQLSTENAALRARIAQFEQETRT